MLLVLRMCSFLMLCYDLAAIKISYSVSSLISERG